MKNSVLFAIFVFAGVSAHAAEKRQAVCVCQENSNIPFGVPTFSLPAVGVGVDDDEAFDQAVIDCNKAMSPRRIGGSGLNRNRVVPRQILAGSIERKNCTFSDVTVPEAQ